MRKNKRAQGYPRLYISEWEGISYWSFFPKSDLGGDIAAQLWRIRKNEQRYMQVSEEIIVQRNDKKKKKEP